MNRALSLAEIHALKSVPTRTKSASTPTLNTDERTWEMWWKLPTKALDCNVPTHDETEASRKRMVAEIGDHFVCRYCFLNSRDKPEQRD